MSTCQPCRCPDGNTGAGLSGGPCPTKTTLQFLNGITLPAAAGTVQLAVPGLGAVGPVNPNPLLTPADVVTFLNTIVIPDLINQGFSVDGVFAFANGVFTIPRINGQCNSRLIPSRPQVPCSPIPLTTFLNGNPYPIAAGAVRLTVANIGPVGPVNPLAITSDADLLAYLNTVVIPALILLDFTVVGTFSISGATITPPRIGDSSDNDVCRQFLTNVAQQPCPPVPLANFLTGLTFPLSAGTIKLSIPNFGPVNPTNPTVINDGNDLITYLNTVVIPALQANNYTVQGTFALVGQNVLIPRIGDSCDCDACRSFIVTNVCTGIPQATFLNGNVFPMLPNVVRPILPNIGAFGPFNTTTLNNVGDLLAYLNNVVNPFLATQKIVVQGTWTTANGLIFPPKVGDPCGCNLCGATLIAPCANPIPFAVFMRGNTLPLPAFRTFLAVDGIGAINPPNNGNSIIVSDLGIQNFLNFTVIPAMQAQGITVTGLFTVSAINGVTVPRINGQCGCGIYVAPPGQFPSGVGQELLTGLVPNGTLNADGTISPENRLAGVIDPLDVVAPTDFLDMGTMTLLSKRKPQQELAAPEPQPEIVADSETPAESAPEPETTGDAPPLASAPVAEDMVEVIFSKAVAVHVTSGATPLHPADGWGVVKSVIVDDVPGYDRVYVYGPGAEFALRDHVGAPNYAAWAAVRVGLPVGAHVSQTPGVPCKGWPSVIMPGETWCSPRVAMPIGIRQDDGSIAAGFKIMTPDMQAALYTAPGSIDAPSEVRSESSRKHTTAKRP